MSLADASARELARRIQEGKTTSRAVVDACIERIEQREPVVGAWTHFDPEFARQQADACDQARADGTPLGPLHGVPVGIKDIFDTKAFPTENGTVLDAGRQPTQDSTPVARLKAAGAVIMGKTVTTETAVYSPGKTSNPHDAERTPGGSSSGSAAAVACGMVPLAIGSQTNGSVIRPASFCGVIGFKPSHGRISRAGALALSRQLDHVGVFARTVEDAALISDCLIGHDPQDPDTQPAAAPGLLATSLQPPPTAPKLAFVKTPVWNQADAMTQNAFLNLAQSLGVNCETVETPPIFETAVSNLRTIMYADLASALDGYMQRDESKLSEILRGMIAEGRETKATAYNAAIRQRAEFNAWVAETSERFDALMTPAARGEAPHGLDATGDPVFCSTWSYLGTPAITLPLLEGETGMPIGVQLVGAPGDDARLLRTAQWLNAKQRS